MEDGRQGLEGFSETSTSISALTVSLVLVTFSQTVSDILGGTKKSLHLFPGTQEEAARAYDIAAIEYRGSNAVTNFDLSTYTRWLRPGAGNASSSSQEHHSNGAPRLVQPSTILPDDEAEPLLHHNNVMDGMNSESEQEFMSHQMFGSGSCNKSSPTALSLLLRSSMYKELMEKNSNACNEIDRNEPEDEGRQLISGDDCCEVYYHGTANAPSVCSPNENKARVEQQESAAIHEYIEQSFWNCLDSVDDTETDCLDHPRIQGMSSWWPWYLYLRQLQSRRLQKTLACHSRPTSHLE